MTDRVPLKRRLWRTAMIVFHRWPIHPGWRHPLRFYDGPGNCFLCRATWDQMKRQIPVLNSEFVDESRVEISKPEYDADGKLVRHGMSMSASMKRNLDEIAADPERQDVMDALRKVMEDIARDP